MRKKEAPGRLPIDVYDGAFLREVFAASDLASLPETPPNYPPPLAWGRTDGAEPAALAKIWKDSNLRNRGRNPTIYVHLPFCEYICRFCGFYRRIPRGPAEIDRYLAALEKEALYFKDAFRGAPIRNLCFGGGTPTMLSEAQLEFLLGIFTRNFNITPRTRIAMEASPQTLTPGKARLLKRLGVSYLSIGIQSFDEKLMRACNRPQTRAQCLAALRNAKRAGIENVEADLMTGLPGQTEETFMRDIDLLSRFDLERVYIFEWQPREFTCFGGRRSSSLAAGDMDRARDWRRRGIDLLIKRQKYIMRCGHWIFKRKGEHWPYTYDQQEDEGYSLLGLGATSISYCAGGLRSQNFSDTERYAAALGRGRLPVEKLAVISERDEMVNYMIVKFLHINQLVTGHFRKKFGRGPEPLFRREFARLLASGRIFRSSDSYVIRDRASAAFDMRAVFYSPAAVEMMAANAGLRPVLKGGDAGAAELPAPGPFRNSRLCALSEGLDPSGLGLASRRAVPRKAMELAAELRTKREEGLDQVIFADRVPLEKGRAALAAGLANKLGYRGVAFMAPAAPDKELFGLLKKSGADRLYLLPGGAAGAARLAAAAGLEVTAVRLLEEADLEDPAGGISAARELGASSLLYILPAGYRGRDTFALYKSLKKNAGRISRAAAAAGLPVKVLNSLPCLLGPRNGGLFESFVHIADARENRSSIIKLETCLICKYLLHCPGPSEKYLERLPAKGRERRANFYSIRGSRYYDIRPVKA